MIQIENSESNEILKAKYLKSKQPIQTTQPAWGLTFRSHHPKQVVFYICRDISVAGIHMWIARSGFEKCFFMKVSPPYLPRILCVGWNEMFQMQLDHTPWFQLKHTTSSGCWKELENLFSVFIFPSLLSFLKFSLIYRFMVKTNLSGSRNRV